MNEAGHGVGGLAGVVAELLLSHQNGPVATTDVTR
jgi:hypothetical protein